MQENTNSANETNDSASSNVETLNNSAETTQEAPTSKRERKARVRVKGAKNKGAATSKARKRSFSTLVVKCKKKGRHILVVTDKKGAETFATGRNELSRAAKINAVLLDAGRPLTLAQIREKLDALYGADHVKALSNHMRALLVKGAAVLKDGAYMLKSKKSAAPVASEAPTSDENKSDE